MGMCPVVLEYSDFRPYIRGAKISQIFWSELKILGARRVT